MNRNTWTYDIETIKGIFTYCAINIDTEEVVKYCIHKDCDESNQLREHLLKTVKAMIGFNNLDFDYPVLHCFLNICSNKTAEETIAILYQKAQDIINYQNNVEELTQFNPHIIKEKDIKIQQLDLYKLWHFNNTARRTSLKSLEISMNFPNVMEMPIYHTQEDISFALIEEIFEYNENDVKATFEFYRRSIDKINLRKSLKKKYNISCLNWSDSKIGEQLILKLYCDKVGIDPWEIKKLRSNRDKIKFKDIVLPHIKFESQEFDNLLQKIKNTIITETKNSFSESVVYKGFKYEFGQGGIHGCIKPGVYNSDEDYIIIDLDVAGLYPSLSITNDFYPEHLGKEFIIIYKDMLNKRTQAKKSGDLLLSDGFKLANNSVYGKSNDKFSFLYDPKFTMSITINGQLLLTMLAEELVDYCGDFITILQINTDGITVKLDRDFLDSYYEICEGWEYDTKLTLEYAVYNKMIIADVNNYLAVTDKGKIKNKGRFEVEKVVGNEIAYHKDNSFKVVPLALQEYFTKGIPVEQTILNHTNIYDFCGRQKFKGNDVGELHSISNQYKEDGSIAYSKLATEKQQKNTRYYLSKNGNTFIKHYGKGSFQKIHAGYKVTIFNKYIKKNIEDYNIDYSFYIKQCNTELLQIENKQMQLF